MQRFFFPVLLKFGRGWSIPPSDLRTFGLSFPFSPETILKVHVWRRKMWFCLLKVVSVFLVPLFVVDLILWDHNIPSMYWCGDLLWFYIIFFQTFVVNLLLGGLCLYASMTTLSISVATLPLMKWFQPILFCMYMNLVIEGLVSGGHVRFAKP